MNSSNGRQDLLLGSGARWRLNISPERETIEPAPGGENESGGDKTRNWHVETGEGVPARRAHEKGSVCRGAGTGVVRSVGRAPNNRAPGEKGRRKAEEKKRI